MGSMPGGAKDVHTFRNYSQNRLPNVSSITYEGLFSEYMFDTQTNKKNEDEKQYEKKDQLILPTYCYAKTQKPNALIKAQRLSLESNETTIKDVDDTSHEYYMTIGLNENFDVNEMKRKPLNLIICVDHSGSMGCTFYYGQDQDTKKTKMQIANESIIALLAHLTDNDRVGIIKFIQEYTVIQELDFVKNINMQQLKTKILAIKANGGEDLGKVYAKCIEMYEALFVAQQTPKDTGNKKEDEYWNRIIFLTDANITVGDTNPNSLCGMMKTYSDRKEKQIMSTFIGVGQDFNTDFVQIVTKLNGGNYYSVHSSDEFMKTMDDEFIFMVSPLALDFKLTLLAEGNSCCIDEVFGSADDEKSVLENGEVMNVKTLFPSAHDEKDEVQGGVVVLKMKTGKDGVSYNMETNVVYKDLNGKAYAIEDNIQFGGGEIDDKVDADYFDNAGIRKSVLLVRYVQLLKEWEKYEKKQNRTNHVSDEYKQIFAQFKEYFVKEMKEIGDNVLAKEVIILDKFIKFGDEEVEKVDTKGKSQENEAESTT